MNETTEETWMPEARIIAAQCWTDEETKDCVMDARLAEAVAKRIAMWMETAAQNERNAHYYRKLVVECGEAIGESAYTQDDGRKSEDVLCAKVPELVKQITERVSIVKRQVPELIEHMTERTNALEKHLKECLGWTNRVVDLEVSGSMRLAALLASQEATEVLNSTQ